MTSIFKYSVEKLPSKLLPGIHQHDNTIYHDGLPPYPSPSVTPSETPSTTNIIPDGTSNDFPLSILGALEEASSGSSFTMQSEISLNGDNEGLVDRRRRNSGSTGERFYCPLCSRDHKGFSRKRDMEGRHKGKVRNNELHPCDECEKSFSRPDVVARHKKDTHE